MARKLNIEKTLREIRNGASVPGGYSYNPGRDPQLWKTETEEPTETPEETPETETEAPSDE